MPVNKEAYIRYRIIDECLRNKRKKHPSMFDLIDACESKLGKSFSESTLQKDLKAMREDSALGFFAPIKYDKIFKGYYYEDESFTLSTVPLTENDIESIKFAAEILHQFRGSGLFAQFDDAVNKIFDAISIQERVGEGEQLNFVQIEKPSYFKGSNWLGVLLDAIIERKCVRLGYQKFTDEEEKTHVIHPYLLKEYRNRWYVIGMMDEKEHIATFGLDRITFLETLTEAAFRRKDGFDPDNFLKHAYGITGFEGEAENVELEFSKTQGKYVLAQALHPSQQVVKTSKDKIIVSLNVGITYELIEDLLGYGNKVKVLKPQKLAQLIKEEAQKTSELYD